MNSKDQKLYGVIGDPIEHSLSPQMHQAGFAALKLNHTYKKFTVAPDELKSFLNRLVSGEISGINVTIPHKESILEFLDDTDNVSQKIGAVNTVTAHQGKLVGTNTDGLGYLNSLTTETGFEPCNAHITVLGAGGACRAIAFSLCEHGAQHITLVNRSEKRAAKLQIDLQKHYPQCHIDCNDYNTIPDCDLLINTTPLGMKHTSWPSLEFVNTLNKNCLVSDIVYNPKETQLLLAAKKRGLKIHYGLGMLLHQGALAFEIFTGHKAPIKAMDHALKNSLS